MSARATAPFLVVIGSAHGENERIFFLSRNSYYNYMKFVKVIFEISALFNFEINMILNKSYLFQN